MGGLFFLPRLILIGKTLKNDMERCDLFKQASAMAYTTLLSLVPSLAALFSIISVFKPLVGEQGQWTVQLKAWIVENLSQGSGAGDMINDLLGNINIASVDVTSFAGLLVTVTLLLRQIEEALNRVWMVRKGRTMVARFIAFWTFVTLGMLLVSTALGALSGFKAAAFIGLTEGPLISPVLRFVVGLSSTWAFFFFLYKLVPNCVVTSREAALGAAVAGVLFQQASRIFPFYVKHFAKNEALYGALAALPLFLTWLYICWLIILFGSVVSWRSREGFSAYVSDVGSGNHPAQQRMGQKRVQTLLPFLILLVIHRHFHEGHGAGLSGKEVRRYFQVPGEWLQEALETLISLGYIVAKASNGGDDNQEIFMQEFFPAFPAHAITSERLSRDLLTEASTEIATMAPEFPPDLVDALMYFTNRQSEGSLATYLEAH